MIAKLTGRLDSTGEDWAIVDCAGVGYLVQCATRTLARLPAVGGQVSLVVETLMREDSLRLIGFASAAERDWFRLLTQVQGVGARIALAILSALHHRNRTGEGQWINSSQVEVGIFASGTSILDWSANGRVWQRYGNRSPYKSAAPHGVYPCKGGDRWS